MTPTPDLTIFLRGEIDPSGFRHADHVRMGFELLAQRPFLESAAAMSRALKAMAARAGAPWAYHETVTLAFLALIGARSVAGRSADFEQFAAANPDLFDKTVLTRWYGSEKLSAEAARRTFLLPDPCR
jgi:hypothetical protein